MRRKQLLLRLIGKLEQKGIKTRTAIVKSLFLLKEEYFLNKSMKFYSFYPYKNGPFSDLCFADLRSLKQKGLIDEQETSLTELGLEEMSKIERDFDTQIDELLGRFSNTNQILRYVYANYPEYTVKSEIHKHKQEISVKGGLYTIGYEGKDIDSFLDMAIQKKIDTVIDVRNNAFSMNFTFIGRRLNESLSKVGIDYLHIPELGIRGEDRKGLENREDYEELFRTYREGLSARETELKRIREMGERKKIALLCFEKDPTLCHRGQIANHLREQGLEVIDL
jgi:uncharacterized protein (DUF488 family)